MSHKQKHRTGIPVFKITARSGCGDGDRDVTSARSQTTLESQSQSSRSSSRNQPSQNENQKRDDVAVHNSTQSKLKTTKKNQCPETWADEVIQSQSQKLRNTSVSDSRKRRDDLEKHLHEAEAQLVTMGKLLEQREKLMNEAAEEAAKKTEELEQKLINQDANLVKHGIDPVTGTQITLDEEGEKKVEASKKFTKKKVQEMKAKLQQMNSQAESYLSDIENTLQFLTGLEQAVDSAGQPSGNILQGLEDIVYEDYKQADEVCRQQTGPEMNSGIRSVLGEKKFQFENCTINFSVNDVDDNEKWLCLEDEHDKLGNVKHEKLGNMELEMGNVVCDKLGNVNIVDAESAAEEKIP